MHLANALMMKASLAEDGCYFTLYCSFTTFCDNANYEKTQTVNGEFPTSITSASYIIRTALSMAEYFSKKMIPKDDTSKIIIYILGTKETSCFLVTYNILQTYSMACQGALSILGICY